MAFRTTAERQSQVIDWGPLPTNGPRVGEIGMNELGMFAKYWQPGKVKTRLAESIGRKKSSLVYKSFIECLLARFAGFTDRCSIAVWPPENATDFSQLDAADGWQIEVQADGGLGIRMAGFFDRALQRSNKVVLIGSDSPNIPKSVINDAFTQLSSVPVVLGPSVDGGYYLVGLADKIDVFSGVQWSTPLVLQQTREILSELNVDYSLLTEWYDIDHESDLRRLRQELAFEKDTQLADLGRKLDTLLN